MPITDATTVAAYLGVTFTAGQTAEATALVPAADAAIARYTDRAWGSGPITGEVYTSDGPLLVLRQRPVASVQQVAVRWYFATPATVLTVGSQYSVRDLTRGLLLLSPWWGSRPNDRPYVQAEVDYTPVSTVPADVALAATMLVAAWLQPSLAGDGNDATPGAILRTRIGDVEVQYGASTAPSAADTLPPNVVALLAPYRSALAFA